MQVQNNQIAFNYARTQKTQNNRNNSANVSFSGKPNGTGIMSFFERYDMKGSNLPLRVLIAYTLGITLGARVLQARDKDERREVVTRDFIAISTFLFGLPALRKVAAKMLNKKTGYALYHSFSGKVSDLLKPEKGMQTVDRNNVARWYTTGSENGIVGFAKNISKAELGGNLAKIFSKADDESKAALTTIASELNVANTKEMAKGLKVPDDNEAFIQMLKDAKESKNPKVQEALSKVVEKMNSKDINVNKVYKYALLCKSIPEIVNFGIITGFLGFLLPWFNIQHTRKLYGKDGAAGGHQQNNNEMNKVA